MLCSLVRTHTSKSHTMTSPTSYYEQRTLYVRQIVMSKEPVQSIYPDEQEKLDNRLKQEVELAAIINKALEDYGYVIEPVMVNGLPEIRFRKV